MTDSGLSSGDYVHLTTTLFVGSGFDKLRSNDILMMIAIDHSRRKQCLVVASNGVVVWIARDLLCKCLASTERVSYSGCALFHVW